MIRETKFTLFIIQILPSENLGKIGKQQLNKEHILRVIKKFEYNKEEAAKALNIGLSSLYRKMEELDIPTKSPKS